jgi:AcrR family transcriptional regulator
MRMSPLRTHLSEAEASLWRDLSPPSSQRLLLAALESFADRGFHGTTTRDIARRARMSPAALYAHYPSKGALLFEISLTAHEAMLRELHAAFAQPAASPPERLANLVRVHASFHATHRTAAQVANYELRSLDPPHRVEIVALRKDIERVFKEAVRLGVEGGHFRVTDLDAACYALLSLGLDVARWFSPGGRLTPARIGELYAAMGLRLVGCQG